MSTLFELVSGGIGVMSDPADNPDNHVNLHHKADTRISFEVLNVGDTRGNAWGGEVMIPLLPSGSHSIWTQARARPVMQVWGFSARVITLF